MNHEPLRPHLRRAVLLTEACVALALVGLVLGVVSLLLTQHARATDYYLNYRRAQLAAESWVEQLRGGVLAVADTHFIDETGTAIEIRIAEATEAWKPLRRARVTASITGKHSRVARYSLTTYVAAANGPEGDLP